MNKLLKKVGFVIIIIICINLLSCVKNEKIKEEVDETKDFNISFSEITDTDKEEGDKLIKDEIKATEKEIVVIEPEVVNNENELTKEDEENMPWFDGSTANLPLMAQMLADYLDINYEEAERKVGEINKTDEAWESIINDSKKESIDRTVLLVYEASEEIKEYINNSDNRLIITPIGVDALVFLKNKNNKVQDLTVEDIQNIYSGKIKNWKDLGGDDINIEAYQRVYNSGSHTLFLKKVMKDIEPTEVKKEYRLAQMGGVFTTLSSYDNTANAIGYSVFYYADKMLDYPNLDFFCVNGVYPSDQTIASGEYPLLNEFYVVIREDAAEGSPARKMYEYILSDKGKESLIKAGYIPYSSK